MKEEIMASGLTNILLFILIGLIGFIAKMFYDKLVELGKKIEKILIADISHEKDIEQLKADRDIHAKRIFHLEIRKN